ncbi:putative photosynthetic complex assembly protein PuhE [Elioraea sp.]|uniref:putative photosynthetic complex assembly protein PuhE n=1 Tax=Elioraea sp. TaxID=2185103 RepID=UPI0025B87F07|nr:putative photosynthetic complex assembly protein PuhE [Elioraea sp.]
MMELLLPALFTVFAWWFSTGAILYLDGLPPRTFRLSLAGASLLALLALWGLVATSGDGSVTGTYLAFVCALMVWAWQEMAFLMGLVTGPRRTHSRPGASGLRRFADALMAILHHELAIVGGAALVIAATWGGENLVGLWTYLLLWVMRLSAKLNLFLGVPNLAEEFLPDHLTYLQSYFRRRPMNLLLPFSVTGGTIGTVLLFQAATADGASAADIAGFTFLATMLALAVIEHWFLVLPIPSVLLWAWSLRADSHGEAPRAWTASMHGPYDPNGLRDVLDAARQGEFGDVENISGSVRAAGGWVEFYATAGGATITACTPPASAEARVTAVGRRIDHDRLLAALAACARPSPAPTAAG